MIQAYVSDEARDYILEKAEAITVVLEPCGG